MGKGVNGREGPLESCHVTPEPIWVNGLVETNDAAPPPRTQRKSFTSGLTEELSLHLGNLKGHDSVNYMSGTITLHTSRFGFSKCKLSSQDKHMTVK